VRKEDEMRTSLKYASLLTLLTLIACPMYHLQTPETVPPGKVAVGAGGSWVPSPGTAVFPSGWVRIGLTPKMDMGIQPFMLGLKLDAK
jgi:hypothetical protein